MPNDTTNVLTVTGPAEDINRFCEQMFDDNGKFDFNGAVKKPESLDCSEGSRGEMAYKILHVVDGWREYLDYPWALKECLKTKDDMMGYMDRLDKDVCGEGDMPWRALGNRYAYNLEHFGHRSWYSWCAEHWGTKWNAYKSELLVRSENQVRVQFEAGWSAPIPVYRALQLLYPSLSIHALWGDEGCECNELVYEHTGGG